MSIITSYQKLSQYYHKADQTYNRLLLIAALLGVGVLIMFFITPKYDGQSKTDNIETLSQKQITCPQTASNEIVKPNESTINTVKQISSIDYDKEVYPGPGKRNIIPPVTKTKFVSYSQLGSCFGLDQQVIVVTIKGLTKVYPVTIADYHIVINDSFGNIPVIIVRSPMSGFYRVFQANVNGQNLGFAHSGDLYKNVDLLVDDKSDTLWTVVDGKAVVGVMTGATLIPIDFHVMNYGKAQSQFTNGKVMTFETGYRRTYGVDPFLDFKKGNYLYQEPSHISRVLNEMEPIIGFVVDGFHYAIPTAKISSTSIYKATANDKEIKVTFDGGEYYAYFGNSRSNQIKLDYAYWYVWFDQYPDTKVI
jgi:hypothetical protein